MTTYTESKIITLTSQSADSKRNGTFLSNVKYDLGLFLKDEPDIIHRQVTLLSAQIPYSFYVVNYTNNTLVFKISTNPTFTTVTIPVGNYNGNSLCTELKTLFASYLGLIVTCTLSPINGQLTITSLVSNFTISSTSTCLGILGFDISTTYTSTSLALTSPYPLNLLGIKILQVRSSVLNMSNYSSVNGGITTLLATIPVSAVPFGMIDYVDKGGGGISFSNTTLDDIDIEILDGETGQFINFNNQDWTMTILITLLRTTQPVEKPLFSKMELPRADRQSSSLVPKAGNQTDSLVPKAGNQTDSLVPLNQNQNISSTMYPKADRLTAGLVQKLDKTVDEKELDLLQA